MTDLPISVGFRIDTLIPVEQGWRFFAGTFSEGKETNQISSSRLLTRGNTHQIGQ